MEGLNLNSNIENKIEKIPSCVDIEFDQTGNPQKFVEMFDQDNNLHIASYPQSPEMNLHIKVLIEGAKRLKEKGIQIEKGGGGMLRLDGTTLYVGGKSSQLGEFNKERVFKTLTVAYPEFEIIED